MCIYHCISQDSSDDMALGLIRSIANSYPSMGKNKMGSTEQYASLTKLDSYHTLEVRSC